jgi:Cu+-exporting ATPase
VAKATTMGVTIPAADGLVVRPGDGVEADSAGRTLLVGNERLLVPRGITFDEREMQPVQRQRQQGRTALLVAVDGAFLGVLYVGDVALPDSRAAVGQLKRLGLRVLMLSGDRLATARAIGDDVGVEEVIAEVRPDEKQAEVQRLQAAGEAVAMVGDGINDAPALAAADLGIAIGSGADVAIEAADVVLMRDDLRAVPQAIRLSRATLRTIKQNLVWALAYNVLLLPLAAGVLVPLLSLWLPPVVAAAAMAASSVSVVSNSLLLRFKRLDTGGASYRPDARCPAPR